MKLPAWMTNEAQIEAIVAGKHDDPFSVLGVHQAGEKWVARCFIPGAQSVSAFTPSGTLVGYLDLRHPGGFFEGLVAIASREVLRYKASNAGGEWSVLDAYACGPVLGPMDDYYAAEGTHLRLFDRLGAHIIQHEGVEGVHFAVWAPNAKRVSVVGDFNAWDGRRHQMRYRVGPGIWEIFVPGIGAGVIYKYEIVGAHGHMMPLKCDPYGFSAEMRPNTASRVVRIDNFRWSDQDYLKVRASVDARHLPMSIYEVHAGSWRRDAEGGFLSYDELAAQLIPYVIEMGFTHIELLPITEHPYDPSWGYQPTGLYAPTSRFGDPAGFARFVDTAHRNGIGVILDWVPAHFPTDEHGLARFDGTSLYEHEDPRLGYHPDWGTAIYNFGRTEVTSFLVNNAQFWIEQYHLDGLRVDAVASMLYLDYSRQHGQWIPNKYGGNENLEAIAFLRRMNEVVYGNNPGAVTIAEESTAWPGVSRPTHTGGLGFGFKWNMGFMHDTLSYLARDPIYRRYHHNEITFSLVYAFSENYVLPLSHDEVVHGKGSLLKKMNGGDDMQKFATLRAYYAFMWGYPGKKLLFMGQEMAPWTEWSESRSLDWELLDYAPHRNVQSLLKRLNGLYRQTPALHRRDCEPEGFQWLIGDDAENSVFAWARLSGDGNPPVVVVTNFTPIAREGYAVPMPKAGYWREILNTDAEEFGGSGISNGAGVLASVVVVKPAAPPIAEPKKAATEVQAVPVQAPQSTATAADQLPAVSVTSSATEVTAKSDDGPVKAIIRIPPLATLYFVFEGK